MSLSKRLQARRNAQQTAGGIKTPKAEPKGDSEQTDDEKRQKIAALFKEITTKFAELQKIVKE